MKMGNHHKRNNDDNRSISWGRKYCLRYIKSTRMPKGYKFEHSANSCTYCPILKFHQRKTHFWVYKYCKLFQIMVWWTNTLKFYVCKKLTINVTCCVSDVLCWRISALGLLFEILVYLTKIPKYGRQSAQGVRYRIAYNI